MPDNQGRIEQIRRAMFGDKADLAVETTVGSGISESRRISLDVTHDPGRLTTMPPPWSENRTMIVQLFSDLLERSRQCPGRDRPQCCQAEGDRPCWPGWREREDPEWYAQAIDLLLSQVNDRIGQQGPLVPALAADEGFELGCLLTEALIRFRWDDHARRGATIVDGARLGGEMRRAANRRRKTGAGFVRPISTGPCGRARAGSRWVESRGIPFLLIM